MIAAETVTSGEICIDGKVVNDLSPKDRDIAMVFQSYALYPSMTVRENISFGLNIRKVPKSEQQQIVDRVADAADPAPARPQAGPAVGRPAPACRDGPCARARSVAVPVRRAAVEPRREAAHRDARGNQLLHQRLGTTIVYVTHDQIEAMTLGDRIAVMKDGVVQQFGAPQRSTIRRRTCSSRASSARRR